MKIKIPKFKKQWLSQKEKEILEKRKGKQVSLDEFKENSKKDIKGFKKTKPNNIF